MKPLNDQYSALRVTLESAIRTPYVLAVAGATAEDGSGVIACNLARSFAESGYKTVVVDPYGSTLLSSQLDLKVPPTGEMASMAGSASNGTIKNLFAVVVARSGAHASISRSRMRAAVAELRMKFDVIIVDAGVIPGSAVALQFAGACDGVILGFRFGRKPLAADRELTARLSSVGASVLGVIAMGTGTERRPEPAQYQPLEAAASHAPQYGKADAVPAPSIGFATKEAVAG